MYALHEEHYYSGEMARFLILELLGDGGRSEVG